MSFRHDRRRRLSADDSLDTEPSEDRGPLDRAGEAAGGETVPRAYAAAAQETLNHPIRDFFPSRYRMMALVTIGGFALVGILELAHAWAGRLAEVVGADEAGVFNLQAAGNVSGWFAAMLLAAAGLVAMFVYALRRHRVDDYHGRYRVWIWTAIGCLAFSLGETTSAAALVQGLCRRAAEWSGLAETVVWPTVLGGLLGVAGIRLLVEVRRCRGAVALVLLAALGFAAAAAIGHGWLVDASNDQRPMFQRGSWLAGYVLMLTALLVYARHVTLEIEGLIAVLPARPRKRKVKRAAAPPAETPVEAPRKSAPNVRTDLDSVARPAPAATPAPAKAPYIASVPAKPAGNSGANSTNGNPQGHRPLSRAERRRLRREARVQS